MFVLGLLLLLSPGFIALICNGYNFRRKENLLHLISRYLLFEFLTIMIAYGIITILKGSITIDFFRADGVAGYTVYHSNFVFKAALLFFVIAVLMGVLERRYHGRIAMIYLVLWGIPGSMEKAAESVYLSSKEREVARRCNDKDNMIARQVEMEKLLHERELELSKIKLEKEFLEVQLFKKDSDITDVQSGSNKRKN